MKLSARCVKRPTESHEKAIWFAGGVHDTLGTVTPKPFPLVAYTPLGVTALLVLWTMLVSPHSKYGDSWAIGPALFALPLVVGLHIQLAYKAPWRNRFVAYG